MKKEKICTNKCSAFGYCEVCAFSPADGICMLDSSDDHSCQFECYYSDVNDKQELICTR